MTGFIQRSRVGQPLRIFDIQFSARSESLAVSSITRRQHAVEHVHSEGDGFEQILRRPHAHQVTRPVCGHRWRYLPNHIPHNSLFLAYAESSNSISVKAYLHCALET